jgi:hypothetical protein
MLEHMKKRRDSKVPRPALLSDDAKNPDQGIPLSLKEFAVLCRPSTRATSAISPRRRRQIVHSIGAFLTVWTSVATSTDAARIQGAAPGGAPGSGAPATNNNTTSTSQNGHREQRPERVADRSGSGTGAQGAGAAREPEGAAGAAGGPSTGVSP